jgi:hypothetical protein
MTLKTVRIQASLDGLTSSCGDATLSIIVNCEL